MATLGAGGREEGWSRGVEGGQVCVLLADMIYVHYMLCVCQIVLEGKGKDTGIHKAPVR